MEGLSRTVDWFRSHPDLSATADHLGSWVTTEPAPSAAVAGRPRKIAVIGTGYVGAVTSTCLAWLGNAVWGLDEDAARAGQLSAGQAPFHEPGLSDLLSETRTDRPAPLHPRCPRKPCPEPTSSSSAWARQAVSPACRT